jgi:tetratricopeptide (TPR) repeat protein
MTNGKALNAGLIVAASVLLNSGPAFGFDFDYELRTPNPMTNNCTQPTLSPAVVIANCMEFLKWMKGSSYNSPQQAQAVFFAATAYVRKGQNDAAAQLFGLAIGTLERTLQDPSPDNITRKRFQIYNNLCWIKAVSGIAIDTAIADCDQSLMLAPNNADTVNGRAFVLYRQRKYADALAGYDNALAMQSENAPALFMRGVVKLMLKDENGANADIKAARSSDSNIDILYSGYGVKVK